ncbi:MAG: ABC transporter substrate-binding protein [Pseudomonadota bacterium]
MTFARFKGGLAALAAAALLSGLAPQQAAAQAEQYFPVPSSRVGPFSAMGTGYYGGIIDYMNYTNIKNGGVNGVKLVWTECETEYNAARTVECFQRLMTGSNGQKMLVFDTLGTPGAYAVINRMAEENVTLAQYGYGRTDAADGTVWPWVFNAASHYWSQIGMKMQFMADQEGGIENMRGKTIVHLHIDSAYGREPLPAMRTISEEWGVKLVEISIPPPGLEQQSQWLQIRRERPDWVTFWGAGSGMNSTGMTNAARVGFPRERLVYVTFGGAEEDMVPAGDAAEGTYVVANAVPGRDFPLIADMYKTLYEDRNEGNMSNPERVGQVYYNRGVGAAVMWVEALKNAQEMHGKVGQPVNGAEFRDGYEALDMTPARLEEIGISGMVAPFALSCEKHDGAGKFRMMQWNGQEFDLVTDWMGPPDATFIRGLVESSAEKFANENGVTPVNCG